MSQHCSIFGQCTQYRLTAYRMIGRAAEHCLGTCNRRSGECAGQRGSHLTLLPERVPIQTKLCVLMRDKRDLFEYQSDTSG